MGKCVFSSISSFYISENKHSHDRTLWPTSRTREQVGLPNQILIIEVTVVNLRHQGVPESHGVSVSSLHRVRSGRNIDRQCTEAPRGFCLLHIKYKTNRFLKLTHIPLLIFSNSCLFQQWLKRNLKYFQCIETKIIMNLLWGILLDQPFMHTHTHTPLKNI